MTESFTERIIRERDIMRQAVEQFVNAFPSGDLWVSDGNWQIGAPTNECGWTNLTAMARTALAETGEQR